jgi:type I restriction-modification system DNA methylase subunit
MPSEGKAAVPRLILDLVERFERNRDSYKSVSYNETQLRREFLDPFFTVLGWDIDNKQGYAEAYKDVIHEDAIKVGEATKAPDYCFRIGGTRKFFLEAKRPAVNIRDDVTPAFQLRRYAWTTKLPLGILTDFEEFAVYDCRVKPDQKDKASVARILFMHYTQYESRWTEIADVFSRDAVLKGSFDKYAEENKAKRGTAAVDDAFLETIESWRKELAENLALRNRKLTSRELNFAVQRIIDRIIFLRICEGRGIEDYARLQKLSEQDHIYKRLGELFREADDRYNSGLFHFQPEKDRHEPPDQLTLALDLDDKLLRKIIKSLYYPESPYVFSALPADVLGQVYEQFLGKVIRLTEGHYAKIDDKPEVKKAGGVYYTPTYIVDYIVQNTVGKLLEGRAPKQAAALRILDPACGSGSFLLGAYDYLLHWHLKYYTDHGPEKWARGAKPAVVQVSGGGWKLTIAERKRILLANIYGVDIDAQAVETTKLSLLLKVLEGETQQSLQAVFSFKERALPDLGDNIKCGNSLIGPDFYQQQLLPLGEEERYRINVFDWHSKQGFHAIFKTGGFDAVIGNPPYGAMLSDAESFYLRAKFETSSKDLDTYALFMERAIGLIRPNGKFSMIVPTGWYSGPKFSRLRRFIATRTDPQIFVNLPYDIFKAWVDTTIFLVCKKTKPATWPPKDRLNVSIITFPKRHRIISSTEFAGLDSTTDFSTWFADGGDEYLTYADTRTTSVIRKIVAVGRPLGDIADVQRGVTPFNLTDKPTHASSRAAFDGTVRRYSFLRGEKRFVRFDHTLAEPKPERYFIGPRLFTGTY